jgi:hypothetical protein
LNRCGAAARSFAIGSPTSRSCATMIREPAALGIEFSLRPHVRPQNRTSPRLVSLCFSVLFHPPVGDS